MAEWYSTLDLLRTIGKRVSEDMNRPAWIREDVPKGVQADQFLHAYYYNRVSDGRRYPFWEFFERHKHNPDAALTEGASWWRNLENPPPHEDRTIYEWAPFLREMLAQEKLLTLTYD